MCIKHLRKLPNVTHHCFRGPSVATSQRSVSQLPGLRPEPNDLATDGLGLARRSTSRATGVALTQPEAASAPVRAGLRCNRIQLDAMRNRANQPRFSSLAAIFGLDPAPGSGKAPVLS